MKRKVAKIGPSTLMISLPSKWCKHFNIQKGAELDIEEQGSELKIKTEGNKAQHEITIDIRNLNERTIKWILGVPNKKGYDIINVLHNANQLNLVNDSFKNIYIGFVITDQTEEKTVFKKVSLETKEEFDPILRRTFLITVSLAEKVVNNLKDRNHKKLKEHLSLERTNNLLVDHCHRLLVKFGYQNYEKTSFYFLLCWNLEKLADEYKYLINYFSNKND
ncbi:hypothetical protein HY498_02130 [Candidatus Woesearchaeota archaeon]|nr:hypothetical protein [Candidatus Woesearchaeota archaeon]